ncbi:MAG: tetratricopeptide repeat protein [Candidatus Delongbacteria bacterium]|nr:tetratricopeptide repeat protein [Candidatus Delongbacteria bacterium]MBN2836114.1 tetratricopeptide repeat protein [Candidatus Delongbacteria bacterium]
MLSLFKNNKKNEKQKKIEESEMYFRAGVAYFEKKDLINSKRSFEKAILLNPENSDAIHNLKVVMKKILIEKKKNLRKSQMLNGSLNKESINNITKNKFGISSQEKKDIDDKQLSLPNPDELSRNQILKILELPSDAVEEMIKEKINNEFKRWRTKVNTSDLKKRYEAETMLSILSKARRVLIK